MGWKPRALKAVKIAGLVVAAAAGLAILLVGALMLQPVRNRLLAAALPVAERALPGSLAVEAASWPSLGSLEFDGVMWTDGPDTLAAVDLVRVSVDLPAFARRDVRVEELVLKNARADIPAITRRFQSTDDTDKEEPRDEDRGGGFPRDGSLPGVPSFAVDRLAVDAPLLLVSETAELRGVVVRASADVRHGRTPSLRVIELSAEDSLTGAHIDSLWLTVDLSTIGIEGNGTVHIPGGEALHLVCSSKADHSFSVRLSTDHGGEPPQAVGLALDGRAEVDGHRLLSVESTLRFHTPGTEELLRVPALSRVLSKPLEGVAPLEGARGVVRGDLQLRPSFAFDATADLFRTSWIDTTHASVSYVNETLSIETLALGMNGLALTASARIPTSGGSASAHLTMTGTDWLARIMPDVSLPESLAVDLFVDADGLVGGPVMDVRVRGTVAAAGFAVDTLDVAARIPAGTNDPLDVDLFVGSIGGTLATHAEIRIKQRVTIRFTPHDAEGKDVVQLAGDATYDPEDRSVTLNDIRLDGPLGRYTVDAVLDSLQRGAFDVAAEWYSPPPLLFQKTSPDSAARAAVDSSWSADGPFAVRIAGDIARSGGTPTVTASATLRLPGPRDLAPLAGGDFAVDDLGPIKGSLRFTAGSCDNGRTFDVRLDLGETAWMDTALVAAGGCGRHVEIDSLLLCFESLRAAAWGGNAGGSWDLGARLNLADSLPLTRVMTGGEVPSVALDMDIRVAGPIDSPNLTSVLDGSFGTKDVRVHRIVGLARLVGDSLDASVRVPDGALAYGVRLDSLTIEHAGRIGGGLSGATSVRAGGPDASLTYAMHWVKNGGYTIRGETFYLGVVDRELKSQRPFEVTVSPDRKLRFDGLDLRGSIGIVTANGYVSPDSADLDADIVIHEPRKPRFVDIADRLWPDSLRLHVRIDGPATFSVTGQVEGVTIAEGTPVRGRLEFRSDPEATRARVAVSSPGETLLDVTGSLPSYRLGDSLEKGPVILDVRINRFPVPAGREALLAEEPAPLGWLDGRIAVRGNASEPCAIAALHCDLAGAAAAELSKYRLTAEGELVGRGPIDTALVRIRREWFKTELRGGDAGPGLAAWLGVTKLDSVVLNGTLRYPLMLSLRPFSLRTGDKDEMAFSFNAPRVALTDFDPLLPPDINLEGTCSVNLSATGRTRNPSIKGSVRTNQLQIASARGAQISPDVALDLGGTFAHPSIVGNVQIRSGFVRVPERMQQLHPTEGKSVLLEAADSARARADTAQARPEQAGDDVEAKEGIDTGLDIDVRVEIPGGFRIIGSRMNVELSGDLRLVQQGERPVLTGQLTPLGGQLLFMGRTFEFRRGNVNFYGGDEMNPSFNLTLETELSGYRIEIKLTGTAKDPEIELTSDPTLSESDIMSLLVFGKPMSELNTSQSGLVQQRTAEILMVYGAVKLQEQMSQQMGVDIITIGQSTRKPDESALVVGKYLNNRTLLKYEQNLENTGAYLINLEYYLTKRIKFETFIDQASETGIEINWSKDY